ncbi:MAG TPA: zinc-ribbon domain-containing protein [Tepidisphaeraceae bacterium]|nr:zinc-ribbon domain-containing protein [Tepidisphaeraceae bacterium]
MDFGPDQILFVVFLFIALAIIFRIVAGTARNHRRHALQTDARICRSCGQSHPAFAQFCRRCGTRL